jgi:DNA-binding transcriptional ArsR family regulator
MPINTRIPDYELADLIEVNQPAQLRAMADPLRTMVLALLLERAATVSELAAAAGRPKSTVAHHVNVLVAAGLLRVVRTRRVRAIEERFYGRIARTFQVGAVPTVAGLAEPLCENDLTLAAAESAAAYEADRLRSTVRYARVTAAQARNYWRRIEAVTQEFLQLPRSGDTMYALAIGLYPTERPTLPEPDAADVSRDGG